MAFSPQRSKEVWQTIHRILKPNSKPSTECLDSLSCHYNSTAERLTASKRTTPEDLKKIINEMPKLEVTTYYDLKKHSITSEVTVYML